MQKDSLSSTLGNNYLENDLSSIVAAATHVTPLASFSKKTNTRDFSDAMDIEEEDTARTPKNKKIEKAGFIP